MKAAHVVGKIQPHVVVRDATSLELQHPQVVHTGEAATQPRKPRIKMPFDGAAIRGGAVVSQTELRFQRGRGVTGKEPQTTAGLVRESLNFCSLWWGAARCLYVPRTNNLYRLRVDKETVRGVALRYGPINKRPVLGRRFVSPHPQGGGGECFTATQVPT